ncbi:MAG: hypothetical protein KF830_00645 [Planctomycetes bacterium]|nr:hypothetical protein [Planctomycetota bacterium]
MALVLGSLAGQEAPRAGAGALPVREVTVFKDGHAYVVRTAPLSPDAGGRVVLENLPAPVLGTFWPFATEARLVAAKASRDTVTTRQAALDLRDVATANLGRDAVVVTADPQRERIRGRLLAVPQRAGAAPPAGAVLLLATGDGTRALPFASIASIEVEGEFVSEVAVARDREQLELTVADPKAGATVGVTYVQRGLRWIPAYRLDIDGAGKAAARLEATLINDLVDLDAATVHLVVGVPKFAFEGLVDPISLQQEAAAVAASTREASLLRQMMSNTLMTQTAGFAGGAAAPEPSPAVEGAEANEDLFVFTVRDVTLRQGERLVLPIAAFELEYRDVYTLLLPFSPPLEVQQGLQGSQILELARELAAPKAMHVLRLRNTSTAPLTTAPALVLAKGRVLAQGRLRYAPVGRETDLEINVAIDIGVDVEAIERGRQNEVVLADTAYRRVDLAGTVELRNHKRTPVEVEVRRRVLGLVDEVGQGGTQRQLDLAQLGDAADRPGWWGWWGWPHWWFRHNGFGEFRWAMRLEAGATARLESSWHYFWR